MATADDIIGVLREFVKKIDETIVDGKREGLLRATEEVYTRYPIDERSIQQTDFGVERKNFALEEIVKESWFYATRAVVWRLQESEAYAAIVKMFNGTVLDEAKAKRLLGSFAHRVSYRFLETNDDAQRAEFLSQQLEAVRKHLVEESFQHLSEVRLIGLVAPAKFIEFEANDTRVLVRRVTADDLIEEQPEFVRREDFPPTPTAILRLSRVIECEYEIQHAVWQAITILRLFRVGSIRELSYTNETESYFALGGKLTAHRHYAVVTNAIIGDAVGERLKGFWTQLSQELPLEGYGRDQKRVDPIETAYQRYSDALLSWGVTVERRISDAVIGLESLFLIENDELSFRLRLRLAKLLGMVGFDPYRIQDAIRRAYDVRSAYLHGDQVEPRKVRRIDEQYGSLNSLLLEVLDYLRCAIVILTMIEPTKAQFIELVDSSFIDENAAQKLAEMLAGVKQLLAPQDR